MTFVWGKISGLRVSAILVFLLAASSPALAVSGGGKRPLALVYNGHGVCEEGCAEAAARVVRNAGFRVRYVRPETLNSAVLSQAALYVQPGGDALEVIKALQPSQLQLLRGFVERGGNYLGICAGAFLADTYVDDAHTVVGLGFIPGETFDFHPAPPSGITVQEVEQVVRTFWSPVLFPEYSGYRYLYFSDGAGFRLDASLNASLEVLAWYDDQTPATIRFMHGLGKVLLSGAHPEAPSAWLKADAERKVDLVDPDGEDLDLAAALIGWLVPR